MVASPKRSTAKCVTHGRNHVYYLLLILVTKCAMIVMFTTRNISSNINNTGEYHSNLPPPKASHGLYPNHDANNVDNNVAITFVGISHSDNTTSDTAINYLVDAACHYGIHSYILLGERDADMTLDKKIAALAHHYSEETSKRTAADTKVEQVTGDGKKKSDDYPKCMQSIHVSTSPGEDEIYNMIHHQHQHQQSHNNSSSLLLNSAQNQLVNNPLDKNNRIARIKRTREYQRQNLRDILEESSSSSSSSSNNQHSAIAVLDLDLLAYPSLPHLIETVYKYIFFPSSTSSPADTKYYHAICANGLMTIMSKSQQKYVTRYYDTYSTILFPNAWLHRDRREVQRRKPVSELMNDDEENEKLASMNQEQTYQYIMQQGIRSIPDEFMSIVRDGKTTTTQQQSYHTFQCQYDHALTD